MKKNEIKIHIGIPIWKNIFFQILWKVHRSHISWLLFHLLKKLWHKKLLFSFLLQNWRKLLTCMKTKYCLLIGFTLVQTISNQTSREVGREEGVQFFRASQIKINQEEEIWPLFRDFMGLMRKLLFFSLGFKKDSLSEQHKKNTSRNAQNRNI